MGDAHLREKDMDEFFAHALTPLGYVLLMDHEISAGGMCNIPSGPYSEYHPNCYGDFVSDPEGNNIEAVHYATA